MGWSQQRRLRSLRKMPTACRTHHYWPALLFKLPHDILLARAGLSSLLTRRLGFQVLFVGQSLHDMVPSHLQEDLPHWFTLNKSARAQSLRNGSSFRLPRAKKEYLKRSPSYIAHSSWFSLPSSVASSSFSQIKLHVKSSLS